MARKTRTGLLLLLTLVTYAAMVPAASQGLGFKLYKLQGHNPGPTLLVIGGIQGDEPGGFTAATLIAMDYQIEKGNVWVVPNLNAKSIMYSSRGLHGDMNRKFLQLSRDDPDYMAVEQVKKLIVDHDVDLVLNLHDGSGFFNPAYIDHERNPYRWGQSVIIDQEEIAAEKFSHLGEISRLVTQRANHRLPKQGHYFVKNTRTREGDAEMEKSLTYFAVRNGKSAFGIEASKSFNTYERASYHLHVIESFMEVLGLEYKRDFALNARDIRRAMYKSIDLSLFDGKFFLPGNDLKEAIFFVPMPRGGGLEYHSGNPLVAVMALTNRFKIKYGNRDLSVLYPQYFDFDESLQGVSLLVDGQPRQVPMGSLVRVETSFRVPDMPGYRVNVIGARIDGRVSEVDTDIYREMLPYRYAIDKSGKTFRIEFYRGQKYCGMLLVQYR